MKKFILNIINWIKIMRGGGQARRDMAHKKRNTGRGPATVGDPEKSFR